MTSERWQQIEAIFQAALDCEPEQRASFLDQACGEDDELRREIDSLLQSDESVAQSNSLQFHDLIEDLIEASLQVRAQDSALIGQTLSHYRIDSLLGLGGMGEVYQARDLNLDRTVALKILPAAVATDAERMRRFVSEAKAASALNHPHVATIYEIGKDKSRRFIAMEYVAGQTLAAKIDGQPLAIKEIIEIGSQIADALDEAHGKGIAHRDIKPANVMLTARAQVKVLDFGLAKIAQPSSCPATSSISPALNTAPGLVMGTMPYMSPEQALGREVDYRSDIFSLGVVLYEMATGKLPFAGANPSETLDLILHGQPEAIARINDQVPAALARIVEKCLAKERERRYQSAQELLLELQRLQRDGEAGSWSAARLAATFSRKRLSLALVALLILALVGLGSYLMIGRSPAINSIVVLPFTNTDPNTEHLSDGITEGLINSLSKLHQLKVIARTTAFSYRGKEADPEIVGRTLKIDVVLTGKMIQQGDSLIVQAELVNAKDGTQIWGEQYRRNPSDILMVQENIARQILERMSIRLTDEERKQVAKRYTENTEAYQLYAQGRALVEKRTSESFQEAERYFRQALDLDPNYALAHVGLSEIYHLGIGSHLQPGNPRALDEARKPSRLMTRSAKRIPLWPESCGNRNGIGWRRKTNSNVLLSLIPTMALRIASMAVTYSQ